ncbi:PaaI family thioesterase [Aliishimia ponticola]|uniref:PaaI family thioesterase n=1 Tax=Aliishimia ponticola TaxID=2499833 RepID=A0A4S4NHQ8_9RHOB|nr:PaaI family thioesterase [Aliishimia ponticola]THH38405.1 PaaI family thioesterase [Aliishimia ponticola]
MSPKMSADAFNAFLERNFPQVSGEFEVIDLYDMGARTRLIVKDKHLRPGGTVSGPTLFGLADLAMYAAILGMVGPKALAVTTNCSIDFMRKPEATTNLIGECRLHKLGRVLAVGDVLIFPEGSDKAVARASLTYSLPPAGSAADIDA